MSDLNTTFVNLPSETTPIDAAYLNAANKRMRSRLPVIDVVEDHGAVVNGSTDDTAAWQAAINAAAAAGGGRIICSKAGVSVIAGALTDTGGANCQLKLPTIDYVDTENITIEIVGPYAPPNVYSVIGATPLSDNHLVLKSTLTAGSGGSMLGALGPAGTFAGFTNVTLRLENLTFRMPANPTHTALDLRYVACADIDNVSVDAGNLWCEGISQQTTATSYAIRLPTNDNGAHIRMGQVDVIGFYNGIEFSEHTTGQYVAAWACRRAFVATAANHASKFQRLGMYHCQRGLVGAGGHFVDVDQYNIEHAASGTWVTVYDIDDPSNLLYGSTSWSVVLANVGQHSGFSKNGGANFNTARVGTAPSGGGSTYVGRDRLVAAAGNNKLTLGATPIANSPLVWVNNTIKWPTTDYTISGNIITFNAALSASDVVLVQYHTTNSSPAASTLSSPSAPTGVSFHTSADVSSAPVAAATGPYSLGNRWVFTTAGTINALRLYANVAGTYKMRLTDNAGTTILATPDPVVVSAAGWVDFPITYAVTAGTTLWAVGYFPAGQWKNLEVGTVTRNGMQFVASGYTAGGSDISALANASSPSYFTDVLIAY